MCCVQSSLKLLAVYQNCLHVGKTDFGYPGEEPLTPHLWLVEDVIFNMKSSKLHNCINREDDENFGEGALSVPSTVYSSKYQILLYSQYVSFKHIIIFKKHRKSCLPEWLGCDQRMEKARIKRLLDKKCLNGGDNCCYFILKCVTYYRGKTKFLTCNFHVAEF